MRTILLVIFGFIVHLVFFYSIFDIYFTSPLVHGMTPHVSVLPSPAKRLVLFVADGLRADKFFELDETGKTRIKFLRNIVLSDGAWGVSHTRVPTESRPGHVALIAGFYEDVSAIAKGWKENPVEFDSVFNESRYTWSWGSPDILPMFSKGATGDHVFMETYPAGSEDFAGADSSKLDTWVFDKFKDFLQSARSNETLHSMLQQDKLVFFLHLLGLDTNGHAHRPYSKEYLDNIGVVDTGIEEIIADLEDFYHHDGKTSYILTADHGMTNWGSHGAGHPSETLTPLVAWGAGIRKAQKTTHQNFPDNFLKAWKLEGVERNDVNQADIATLMSCLIGIPFPINNVGSLPSNYLGTSDHFKAESMFANAQQMVEQFDVKRQLKKLTTLSALFKPFSKLTVSQTISASSHIRNLINAGKYQDAIVSSKELIETSLEGLTYYHNYDRFFLGTSVMFGYLGWIGYILSIIVKDHSGIQKFKKSDESTSWISGVVHVVSVTLAVIIITLLYVQSLPWTHYVYCLIPVLLWDKVLCRLGGYKVFLQYAARYRQNLRVVVLLVAVLLGLELLLLSFFYRKLLSFVLFLMGCWPLLTPISKTDKVASAGWVMSCMVMICFPLMPVVGRDHNYNYVVLAGIVACCASIYCFQRPECGLCNTKKKSRDKLVQCLTLGQIFIICLAVYVVKTTAYSIEQKAGLPLFNQIFSWSVLGSSMILPMISNTQVVTRLFKISLSFISVYLLLSTAHESLFVLSLCCLMYFWMRLENAIYGSKSLQVYQYNFIEHGSITTVSERPLVAADLRRAYFFLFFIMTAFFGTGNIASINSFDPASVYCFVTVFSPFVMGGLMLIKIIIPFLLVTCTFQAIHVMMKVPLKSLFLVVLLMSDFMALHFFFLVKDYGSWLDIGTSISHYVIVMATILFLMLLVIVARILTTCSIRRFSLQKKQH